MEKKLPYLLKWYKVNLTALATLSKQVSFILSFCLLFAISAFGQTNPAPQTVPYSQDFSSFNGSSTAYPAGWQGGIVSANTPSSTGRTGAPTADKTISGGTASSTTNGIYDYNGKIGFLSNSSADNVIMLAVNTTGSSNVGVSFDAMTIRNTHNGTTDIILGLVLQYRVGTSGSFTNLTYSMTEYQNAPNSQQISGTTGQNIKVSINATLPVACDNQAIVQIRWIYRTVSSTVTTDGRPTMAIDNVYVGLSTGAISPTTLAPGDAVSVPYIANGTYTGGNIFTAQLSDNTGSFAAPTSIGTITSTTSGSISGTIPNATTSGSSYRIRVVSSTPFIQGSDNGINITIVPTTNYYYDGTGSLADITNWGTATNGTGINPINFTSDGQIFNVRNTTSVTTAAAWTVAGTGSKIIVGDASLAAVTLTVASGFPINGTIDIPSASSLSNSVVLQDVVTPTFGTMAASSEVHYQATLSTGTSRTFGKLFVDGSGTTTTFVGTPIIQTSLFVASGATMATGNLSGNYITINSGASATINGTFQTQKSAGLVSSSVTPGSTFGTIQFIGTENLTLGATSTLVFNRASSGTAQTIDARTDYKNLTISGLDNNKTFASGTLGISGVLTVGLTVTATTGTSNLTAVNPFNLTQNSTITLSTVVGTAVQSYTFADNSSTAWTTGKTLTINGWTGTAGATGTTGRVFFGNSATGLTTQQISQIVFNVSGTNYAAIILSTGEVVPTLTVLPISLISFTGKKEINSVQLKWSTATESNNQRFEILRAGTDRTFKKIGEVNGNGNSNIQLYYTFNDNNPLNGINYYQLKQVDFDGKSQEFGPVAVTANFDAEALQVSSLSSQTEILVFLNSNTSKAIEINIYDLAGRNLISQKTNADAGFNTFKLASLALNKGIHILKITSQEGTLVKKFTY